MIITFTCIGRSVFLMALSLKNSERKSFGGEIVQYIFDLLCDAPVIMIVCYNHHKQFAQSVQQSLDAATKRKSKGIVNDS